MPIPNPKKTEKQQQFVSRCMSDPVMVKDFPDQSQRAAVCYASWSNRSTTKAKKR